MVNQDLKFKLDRFYEVWKLKESYIKCFGQGVSISLKLFAIELCYKVAACSLSREIFNNIRKLD
ncbi:4'-phosphopantetheinyl transferase superfamily protein [Clostridium acidisoli]|uniref:4'-phosphopantetheinyl transferase superfamily protein n=1 Tax=Clostridium acidisoli TaxID=91624 RepID=UPI003BFA6EA7